MKKPTMRDRVILLLDMMQKLKSEEAQITRAAAQNADYQSRIDAQMALMRDILPGGRFDAIVAEWQEQHRSCETGVCSIAQEQTNGGVKKTVQPSA